MLLQEFEARVGMKVTAEEFEKIHEQYMLSDYDKDEYCKVWKRMMAGRIKKQKAYEKVEQDFWDRCYEYFPVFRQGIHPSAPVVKPHEIARWHYSGKELHEFIVKAMEVKVGDYRAIHMPCDGWDWEIHWVDSPRKGRIARKATVLY